MRILIVEDEYYLAADLAAAVAATGAEVVGPVGTLADAEAALAGGAIDRAVIDVNLHGAMSFPLAEKLEAAHIPYLIATGYSAESLPEKFRGKPRLEKPFRPERVAAAIRGMD